MRTMTKKNRFAALLAVIAAIAMVFTLFAGFAKPAFAASGNDAKITVTNTVTGSDYKLYKVFDANSAEEYNRNETTTPATADNRQIAYTYTKSGTTDNFLTALQGTDSPFTLTQQGTSDTYNVTLKEGKQASDIVTFLRAEVTNGHLTQTGATQTATAKSEGSTEGNDVTFSSLAYGYYYIDTTTGTAVTVNSAAKEVTVEDKNSVPTVDKTITGVKDSDNANAGSISTDAKTAIAQVGSTVTYSSVITVGKGAENYVFKDLMDEGLQFDTTASNIVVKYLEAGESKSEKTLVKDTDYTLDTTSVANDYTFKISFNKSDSTDAPMNEGDKITITYNATVTSAALQTTSADNSAKVEYGHKTDVQSTPNSETKVYNAKLTVTKNFQGSGDTNLTSGNYLVAGFKLYKTVDGTKYYYKETKTSDAVTKIEWTSTESDATELKTTSTNNVLEFVGLPTGSYTLTETTVPAGYNKAADQTITVKSAQEANFTVSGGSNDMTLTSTVQNNKGTALPSTGGIGTTLFYIIGGVIVAGAVVMLVMRRRRNA